MKVVFVAHSNDSVACLGLHILRELGYATEQVSESKPLPTQVGLFSVEGGVRNRFLRVTPHRMNDEGIDRPEWTRGMPFVVAICRENTRLNQSGFRKALAEMASTYAKWGPWMNQPNAPWNPFWHEGTPHPAFGAWHDAARGAVAATPVIERLEHRLAPIFKPSVCSRISTLVVTGCALFNQPHTDVTDRILRAKRTLVLDSLECIVHETQVSEVLFIVPDSSLLREELRLHFHPFMFMDLKEVSDLLGTRLDASARLFGASHAHARATQELAEALNASAAAITRDIVGPLQGRINARVTPISWEDYVGTYIARANELAQTNATVAKEIYARRVATRPSYASLHRIDPERGLQRTISNNVLYLAEALFLRDHPEVAVANYEFESVFWLGLEPVLERDVWGSYRPFIGMAPIKSRQPWSY